MIPVVECIRAFLTPTKFLAYGLLEPDYLKRVISRNEITDQSLRLDFTTEIALKSLTPPVIKHFARLLYDRTFEMAWQSVYGLRRDEAGRYGNMGYWPLGCILPSLAPRWTVRAINGPDNTLIVLEILQTQSAHTLEFTTVQFSHPRLSPRKPKEDHNKSARKKAIAGSIVEGGGSPSVDHSSKPPKSPREPRLIQTAPLPVQDRFSLSVKKIPSGEPIASHATTEKANASSTGKTGKKPKDEHAMISLSDIGGGGDTPAAEFSPDPDEPIDSTPGDGLKEFARVVAHIEKDYRDVTVKWLLRELPPCESSFVITSTGQPRKYAAVRLHWPSRGSSAICWIIELGRPDRYSLSTLLVRFRRNGNKTDSLNAIKALLNEILDPRGWWLRGGIEAAPSPLLLAHRFIPHVNRSALIRAKAAISRSR